MSFLNLFTHSKHTISLVATATVTTFGPLTAMAEDAQDEIIVTAKTNKNLRDVLPTSHVINAEDIELMQAKDLTTLLRNISGVSISDTGGRGTATSVFLRGASLGQTIVLIDGVRVGSATLGSATLNAYPIESIARIEVVKGPLSGIYGADAVGGVIQIFTKNGGNTESRGSISVGFGTDSLQEYALTLNAGDDKNGFFLSALSENTDGIDRTSIIVDGNEDQDAFEQTAFNFGGTLQLGENTNAKLSVLQSDSTADFDNTFGPDIGSFTETQTLSTSLGINHSFNQKVTLHTSLGYNEDQSITFSSFPSDFGTERISLNSELEFTISDGSSALLGIDYYEEEVSPIDTYGISKRDNKGVFALYQVKSNQLSLVANLRHDNNSAYGSDTNGSIAVDYALNDSLRATASYGTAFVAPSFNFLYFPFFGNPDILPEESKSAEISLRGNTQRATWRISAYQNDIQNLFSFDPATFLAANIGSAKIKGIEAELSTQLAGWELSAAIDFLSAKDLDTGIELDDRAQKSLTLVASRAWQKLDLRFAINAESDRYDLRGTEVASFALLDVNAGYQFNDRLRGQVTIDNIFDKDYTVNLISADHRYNTERRQARLQLSYQF